MVYCASFSFSIISIEIQQYRIGNILFMEEIWTNHFTGRLVPLSTRGVMCTSEVFSCISSINSTKQNEQNKSQNCKIQLFTLLTVFNGVHDINEKTSHSWCCVFPCIHEPTPPKIHGFSGMQQLVSLAPGRCPQRYRHKLVSAPWRITRWVHASR